MGKKLALLAFATIFPASAAIAGPAVTGVVDIYAVPKTVVDTRVTTTAPSGSGAGNADADGFGAKGLFKLGAIAAFTVDYQRIGDDSDFEQYRLGAGAILRSNVGGFVEYAKFDLDTKNPNSGAADGFGLHVRYSISPLDDVQVYGDIGYLMLKYDEKADGDDLDGLEYTLGGAFSITENWGFFADYRVTDLEGEFTDFANNRVKVERKFSDIRLGARFEFGG